MRELFNKLCNVFNFFTEKRFINQTNNPEPHPSIEDLVGPVEKKPGEKPMDLGKEVEAMLDRATKQEQTAMDHARLEPKYKKDKDGVYKADKPHLVEETLPKKGEKAQRVEFKDDDVYAQERGREQAKKQAKNVVDRMFAGVDTSKIGATNTDKSPKGEVTLKDVTNQAERTDRAESLSIEKRGQLLATLRSGLKDVLPRDNNLANSIARIESNYKNIANNLYLDLNQSSLNGTKAFAEYVNTARNIIKDHKSYESPVVLMNKLAQAGRDIEKKYRA